MRVTAQTRFAIVPEWVLFAPISATAVRLYGVLARHADKDEHFAIVGRRKLAAQMRSSVLTVDRAMGELGRIGAVSIEHRDDPANPLHRLENRYHLAVVPPETTSRKGETRGHITAGQPSLNDEPTLVSPVTPPSLTGDREVLDLKLLGSKALRSSTSSHTSRKNAAAPRPHARDLIFEELCKIQGHGWADLNSVERGKLNRARKLAAESNATPETIRKAADRWPEVMGELAVTALGVMSNYHRLLEGPGRASPEPKWQIPSAPRTSETEIDEAMRRHGIRE